MRSRGFLARAEADFKFDLEPFVTLTVNIFCLLVFNDFFTVILKDLFENFWCDFSSFVSPWIGSGLTFLGSWIRIRMKTHGDPKHLYGGSYPVRYSPAPDYSSARHWHAVDRIIGVAETRSA